MAGRRAKPIGLHLAEGNPNRLTKAEIKRREKAEVKLGSGKIVCPRYIVSDPVAHKKWRELIADYNRAKAEGAEIIKSSDAGILARYCKTHSEYMHLLEAYQRVSEIHYDCEELDDYIESAEEFNAKVKSQLRDLFAISAILTLESAINKKMDQLVKMEDRLFLHPLAKVRNIPKKEPEKVDPLAAKGFGNV